MHSRPRFALLAYTTTATIVGAIFMYALVRATLFEPSSSKTHISAQTGSRDSSSHVNRFAYFRPGTLDHAAPPSQPSPLRPTTPFDPTHTGSWSTEVRPETKSPWSAQRVTRLPERRLRRSGKRLPRKRRYTLKKRLAEISPAAKQRLAQKFQAAQAAWPPAEIALLGIKDKKVLELHARPRAGAWKLIHQYPVLAASGGAGPKLRRGDKQVPEGVYRITFLNPNSAYHVSLRVNYPNAFDRRMAAKDGRKKLGGDIMIHGKNSSAGCLAMGDDAAEELFVMAAVTGLSKIKLIIAPTDFRKKGLPKPEPGQPSWLPQLYAQVATAMSEYKAPRRTGLLSLFMD